MIEIMQLWKIANQRWYPCDFKLSKNEGRRHWKAKISILEQNNL